MVQSLSPNQEAVLLTAILSVLAVTIGLAIGAGVIFG